MGTRIATIIAVVVVVGLAISAIIVALIPRQQARNSAESMHEMPARHSGSGSARNTLMQDYGKPRYSSNGEKIFLTGHNMKGQALTGTGMAKTARTRNFGCANCHGADGRGGITMPDGKTVSADITWKALTSEHPMHMEGMEEMHEEHMHKPYNEKSIKRAITQGIEPNGESLNTWMPRWKISGRDLADLIAYLKRL